MHLHLPVINIKLDFDFLELMGVKMTAENSIYLNNYVPATERGVGGGGVRGGEHVVGADAVGVHVASCLHSIS